MAPGQPQAPPHQPAPPRGRLHHVELWVPDLAREVASLGWLLEALGYQLNQDCPTGRSWQLGPAYLVAEARRHGWTLLFPERYPYAGGPDSYAGYLANADGFEVELVAST